MGGIKARRGRSIGPLANAWDAGADLWGRLGSTKASGESLRKAVVHVARWKTRATENDIYSVKGSGNAEQRSPDKGMVL